MSARVLGAGGLVLAVVLFFAVNSLSRTLLSSSRIDLTENRIYTLSEGTRAILARLEEPITLRFYYSKSLAAQVPGINTYAGRILGLLEEYRREAGGKLTLEAIDPEPFSEEEDRAVGYGLRGLPARAGQGQDLIYFGLVGTNSVDDEEVIPYFSPLRERFLEYDLTRMVHSLADPERPVVGVLGTLPVFGNVLSLPGAGRGAGAVGGGGADAADLRRAPARSRRGARRGHRRADARASAGLRSRPALPNRPVRPGRRQGARLRRPPFGVAAVDDDGRRE